MEEEPREEVSKIQKLKIAASLGIVAVGVSAEVIGINAENNYLMIGGLAGVAAGAVYVLKQLPESSQQYLGEMFNIPGLKKK